ncbi:MAG: sulfatase [Gemmataceae bacterium]|nr:sulfatase [Gemmataceae bacterium]
MRARHLLVTLAALLLAAPAVRANPQGAGKPAKRPNVLFIAVDDLNTSVGCYGHPLVKTPNIDRLAKAGVRFDRAYCQFPLCNPSRSSLLTGRYPTTTRVVDNLLWVRDRMPDVVTLPEFFRLHGYVTLRVGKIFHGGLDDQKAWVEGGEPVKPRKPRTAEQAEQYRKQSDRWVAVEGKGEELPDYRTASKAIELLEKHRDGPFFLAVGFVKPHTPLIAPKRFFDHYDPAKLTLPADFAAVPTVGKGVPAEALTPNGDLFIKRQATKEEARRMTAAYYACVSFVDEQVGRVLEALDRLGLRENTILVFFSDHGFHLGEKGKWSKHGSLYEAGTRVPMIVAAPKAPANGKTSGRTVGLVDLYPTLADLARLPAPKGVEGQSLAPLLKDAQAAWDHPAFTVATRGKRLGRSVRTERWRYTEWDTEGKKAELYDHKADPHELRNLAGEAAHADTVAALRRVLRERLPAMRQGKE